VQILKLSEIIDGTRSRSGFLATGLVLRELQLILRNCYFTLDIAHSVHIFVIDKCDSRKTGRNQKRFGIRHPQEVNHL
jgi:hypothetical protein